MKNQSAVSRVENAFLSPSKEMLLVTNLQSLMQAEALSETELARRTAIPQPTLHKILAGKTEDPRISTLQSLAGYFGVSVDDFFSDTALLKKQANPLPAVKSIPLISWEECLKPNPTAALNSVNHTQWIVVEHVATEGAYVLTSRPSMEPRFPKGTLFIVAPHVQPADGDLVVVHYPNTTEAALREFSVDGPHRLLESVNHNTTADPLTDKIQILATILQSRFAHR